MSSVKTVILMQNKREVIQRAQLFTNTSLSPARRTRVTPLQVTGPLATPKNKLHPLTPSETALKYVRPQTRSERPPISCRGISQRESRHP